MTPFPGAPHGARERRLEAAPGSQTPKPSNTMTSTIHIILPPAERAEGRPRRDCCAKAIAQSHWSYLSRCWMHHAAFFIRENREHGGARQVFSLN